MFYKGQKIRNRTNGITGAYMRTFRATGVGEIIVVKCLDDREYRAPEYEWEDTDNLYSSTKTARPPGRLAVMKIMRKDDKNGI